MRIRHVLLLTLLAGGCYTGRAYDEHEREERRERAYERETGAPGVPYGYHGRDDIEVRREELYRAACENNYRWHTDGSPEAQQRLQDSIEVYRREMRENPDLDRCADYMQGRDLYRR